ncbi:MAG TPA: hypothetical protein VFR20_12650 [Burkholderiaceae bacterium]|nr:hypothetical protein [Burkholderiaceae bacterium]
MKSGFVVVCAAVSLLSGCALHHGLDQASLQEYQKQCDQLGFKSGTDAYSNCLLKQQEMDNDNTQRQMDRFIWQTPNQQRKGG